MPQCASPQMRLLVLVFTSATEHPTEPIDVIFRARDPCAARTLLTLDLGRNVDLRAGFCSPGIAMSRRRGHQREDLDLVGGNVLAPARGSGPAS